MLKSLKLSLLPIILISTIITSCGYDEEHIRDYRFKTISQNQEIISLMDEHINEFNRCAGEKMFTHVKNSSTNYNSEIVLVKNLQKNDSNGAVGYGTQIIETNQENPIKAVVGDTPKKKYIYTGKVELDSDYVLQRLASSDENSLYDLKKLTLHELAHTIGMQHTDNPSDVMYPNISGQKDFDAFCKEVKQFVVDLER